MEQIEKVENKIITLRNQQVILDCDVAELYGVQTKRINEAVRNNLEKFPEGYVLHVEKHELAILRSKFLTAKLSSKSRTLPYAFTEKGLYMLATILKSPQAVKTTIAIVEAYAKLKELSRIVVEVPDKEESQQKTLLQRGGQLINEILDDTLPKQSQETSICPSIFYLLSLRLRFQQCHLNCGKDRLHRLKNRHCRTSCSFGNNLVRAC